MKKYYLYLLHISIITLSISCSNNYESVFQESADERVRQLLENHRNVLLSAENGWKAYLQTGIGGEFFFYFDFNENGNVSIVSDFNQSTAGTPQNSTYLMKALQRPTLTFSTYSYVHYLTDPDAIINNGIVGEGLVSDFEFVLTETQGDTIKLEGLRNQTPLKMVMATPQEKAGFINGDLALRMSQIESWDEGTTCTYINTGSKILSAGIDANYRLFNLFNEEVDRISQKTINYTFSLEGLQLSKPITAFGLSFDKLLWSDTQNTLYIPDSPSNMFIENSVTPLTYTSLSPPAADALGTSLTYIYIDTSNVKKASSAEFLSTYKTTESALKNNEFLLQMRSVSLRFNEDDEAILNIDFFYYGSLYSAGILYSISKSPSDIITFTPIGTNGLADLFETEIQPIRDYFENHSFTLDYVPDPSTSSVLILAYPQEDDAYFYGYIAESTLIDNL